MGIDIDPDKLADFVYNQKTRIKLLREDNSIYRAGLRDDEANWRAVHRFYADRGDKAKADAILREMESLRAEHSHYEDQRRHLETLDDVVDDLRALPQVRDRYDRIAEAQRAIEESERRALP